MLSEKEFQVLNCCRVRNVSNQREIAEATEISLGGVNAAVKKGQNEGWITSEYEITPAGMKQLAPYKVDNAIIMAAGMSSRLAPLSYQKPKGMLLVKGEVLIERQIEQLQQAGIRDITIVVGYMKEAFFYLEKKYGVSIMINEEYFKYNNPSTLLLTADLLKNTYICSSDDYFTENVFEPYVYRAYYAVQYTTEKTEEYCVYPDDSGLITKVTIGGEANNWYMIGHAYFSREFSQKFVEILKSEYETNPIMREELWEKMYMRHLKELKMHVRKYADGVINEFDSLDELRSFDEHYINNTNCSILKNICKTLHCEEKDIIKIEAIKNGLTNTSFKFECMGKQYVYRHPGIGTDEYIHRDSEEFSMQVARELRLDDTYIFMDPVEGWKISYFVEDAHTLNYHNEKEVRQAICMIRKLHDANIHSKFDFDIIGSTKKFIQKIDKKGRSSFRDFEEIYQMMQQLYAYTEKDGVQKRLCHCDCYDPNFLVDKHDKIYLIDWEYSGNDDPANDLGTFICCSDYTYEQALGILKLYFGREMTKEEKRHYLGYIAIASYYWFTWAIFQESIGNTVGQYLYIWYKNTQFYAQEALELYRN